MLCSREFVTCGCAWLQFATVTGCQCHPNNVSTLLPQLCTQLTTLTHYKLGDNIVVIITGQPGSDNTDKQA